MKTTDQPRQQPLMKQERRDTHSARLPQENRHRPFFSTACVDPILRCDLVTPDELSQYPFSWWSTNNSHERDDGIAACVPGDGAVLLMAHQYQASLRLFIQPGDTQIRRPPVQSPLNTQSAYRKHRNLARLHSWASSLTQSPLISRAAWLATSSSTRRPPCPQQAGWGIPGARAAGFQEEEGGCALGRSSRRGCWPLRAGKWARWPFCWGGRPVGAGGEQHRYVCVCALQPAAEG